MSDDETRRLRRNIRLCLWAAIVLNIAIPFLLWSAVGRPPYWGFGNFAAAGMAIWADRFTQRHQEGNGGR